MFIVSGGGTKRSRREPGCLNLSNVLVHVQSRLLLRLRVNIWLEFDPVYTVPVRLVTTSSSGSCGHIYSHHFFPCVLVVKFCNTIVSVRATLVVKLFNLIA